MSMMVISTAIRHCLSGHIEPPSMEIQQKLCAVMAEEVHQQLRILPERLEMYEKGLVSSCRPRLVVNSFWF